RKVDLNLLIGIQERRYKLIRGDRFQNRSDAHDDAICLKSSSARPFPGTVNLTVLLGLLGLPSIRRYCFSAFRYAAKLLELKQPCERHASRTSSAAIDSLPPDKAA